MHGGAGVAPVVSVRPGWSRWLLVGVTGIAMLLSGCAGDARRGAASPERPGMVTDQRGMATVRGSLYWRERMPAPPGAQAIVSLLDTARADAPAVELARQTLPLDGRSPPLAFELTLPAAARAAAPRALNLRAVVRSAEGRLLWTTDRQMPIDATLAQQELPPLQLVAVPGDRGTATPAPGVRPAAAAALARLSGTWQVEDLQGAGVIDRLPLTLVFDPSGQLHGSAGCNAYSAPVQIDGRELQIGTMALTQRACIPAVAQQQDRFVALLRDVRGWRLLADGALELTTEDGRRLRARR
jgi:putative lipoprotein